MIFFSLLSLASTVICILLAVVVYRLNTHSPLNRIFALLCCSFSWWSFLEFLTRQAETAERATFWLNLSIIWPITVALLFHFILVFTHSRMLYNKIILVILYIMAITIMILDAVNVNTRPVLQYWGWSDMVPSKWWYHITNTCAALVGYISLGILIMYYFRAPNTSARRQARFILIGMLLLVFSGTFTEWFLPLLSIKVPEMTNTAFAIMAIMIGYAIWRHDLFSLNPAMAAEAIIQTMSDALIVVNMERRIEIVNNSLLLMLGYHDKEIIGKEIDLILSNFKQSGRTISDLFRTGIATDVETKFCRKNGALIPVSLSWSVLRDANQKLKGMVFIGRDITERERAKNALQKAREELEKRVDERTKELSSANELLRREVSERQAMEKRVASEKERLSVTLRSIINGVITADIDGRVVLLNKSAEDLTGWTQTEAEGRLLSEVYRTEDDMQPGSAGPIERIIERTRNLSNQNSILVARDGNTHLVSESVTPILDKSINVTGWVMVFRDIAEKQQLEDELFKAKKLESLSLLASGIAHDFNNILTGIITNLFMAKMSVDPQSEASQLISTAEKAAFRASSLTNQLLTFAKGGAPVKENASIKELIEDSVGFYLSGSKADYKLDLPEDLYSVEIDRGQIDQVLNNIIINADQAMPEGGIITVRAENVIIDGTQMLPLTPGPYIRVHVSDQGEGIPQDHLTKIFDPYFTTRETGNGLGLTTAYAIIQRHGGHITVNSELGTGTTFTIYIPALEKETGEEQRTDVEEKHVTCEGKGRILIMDDEEAIRKSAEAAMTHLGYVVVTVKEGSEAVKEYKDGIEGNQPFDTVILDLTIPGGMGGKEAAQQILAIDHEAKVIISSGYTTDPIVVDYINYGFCASISKPYNIEELCMVIQTIINSGSEIKLDGAAG